MKIKPVLTPEETRKAEALMARLRDEDGVLRWGAKDPRLSHEEAVLLHVYLWEIPWSTAAEIVGMARGTMPASDVI